MTEERLLSYHRFTREHGVNCPHVRARARDPAARLPHLPAADADRPRARQGQGAADRRRQPPQLPRPVRDRRPALPWRRPLHYVAKVELFERRWQGWLLNRLGAYPVRRGQSDEETLITSREVLERGGADLHLPRGHAHPHRLAGTPEARLRPSRARDGRRRAAGRGPRHRPGPARHGGSARARSRCAPGRALTFPRTESPSPALANSVGARIWPVIELQWEWLGGLPPLRKAAVIGAGSWGTAVAVLLARGGLEVQLGCRTAEQAEEMAESRTNERYLPGVQLPDGLTRQAGLGDRARRHGPGLPRGSRRRALPAAVGAIGDRVGQRSAVLMLSKGLVAPMGALPSEYVGRAGPLARDRLPRRPGAREGGRLGHRGARARQRRRRPARPARRGLRRGGPGLRAHRRRHGVEMAGVAKNAAAVAAAAAEPHGMNAAGIATAEVWRECLDYARAARRAGSRPSPAWPASAT